MERESAPQLQRNVGRRIAEIRRARSLTQAELAEQLDVTPRYVQSVEGGRENLTLSSLASIAAALKVAAAAFFETPTSPSRRTAGRPRGS